MTFQMRSQMQGDKMEIGNIFDAWHRAAGSADFDAYFNLMTSDAVFIGTDASENWQIEEFKAYAKPHFDRGKAWNFKAVERQVYIDTEGNYAWFDELLDTQMKLCRGSGVLRKESGEWKIAHYVLSLVIPNENVSEIILMKQEKDDSIIKDLTRQ
ncbi:nuclear transport factor 2 family protein [Arenibacter sp. ARW7G5Y1]|uniref:nuclear transport factor 2 family protein n=1 Tax=Arenibacter sp. ARW7G5Y1 TaxID=2135619 RepID=UPI0021ABB74E|nr:nuclear transport factor 2 family protein [Arenibacter sp. ARW7G5Y1]